MTAEAAIYDLLRHDATVSGLVAQRIFPLCAAGHVASPYLTYQRVSGERWRSFDGPSGMAQPRVQVDAYAGTYAAAKALAQAVRLALNGFRGVAGGVRVGGISLETDQDLFEDDIDPKLYRVSMDFMVTHDE